MAARWDVLDSLVLPWLEMVDKPDLSDQRYAELKRASRPGDSRRLDEWVGKLVVAALIPDDQAHRLYTAAKQVAFAPDAQYLDAVAAQTRVLAFCRAWRARVENVTRLERKLAKCQKTMFALQEEEVTFDGLQTWGHEMRRKSSAEVENIDAVAQKQFGDLYALHVKLATNNRPR
jgi:hypothetical protein